MVNTKNELVSVLRIDIRQGHTENLRHWIHQLPLKLVWSVLMNTYANDIGCAPLASYIWKKYKEGDIVAAYDVANSLCVQKKSRMVRFVTTVFWKNSFLEAEPFKKLLGQLVGDLQSAYRYTWNPYLQFRVFVAASKLSEDLEEAWDYIIEISEILGKQIHSNLVSIRNMYKVTENIELFVFAVVSISQPGEWETPELSIPKPFVSPTWNEPVPDYCHDLTTEYGWVLIAEISLERGYTHIKAIKFGIKRYYKASLKVSNERLSDALIIYKKFAMITDDHTDKLKPLDISDILRHRIKNIKLLQDIKKKGIIDLIIEMNNSKFF